jgi:hypothetical protein
MSLQIGDLVRVRAEDRLGKRLGIVTEVKQLVHDPSGEGYTAITALVGTQSITFSERDFELVKRADKND